MKTVKDYNLPLNSLKDKQHHEKNKYCAILPRLCWQCQRKAKHASSIWLDMGVAEFSGVTYQRQPRQMPGGPRAPKGPNGPRRGPQRWAYKAACTHDNSWLFCHILWIHWRRNGSSSLLDTSSNCGYRRKVFL